MTKILIDEATVKLALEALELNNAEWESLADSGDAGFWHEEDQAHYQQTNKAISALREALEQPAQKCSYPYCGCNSKAWCKVERNEALDKKTENARELGLDYEPAQQEPVAWRWQMSDVHPHLWQVSEKPHKMALRAEPLYTIPPQRKPLTDEEIEDVWRKVQANDFHDRVQPFARAIEAKIKENT